MPSLRESKLYKTIVSKTLPDVWNACHDFCVSGKNVNIQDMETKETYMHYLADHIHKFTGADGVTVIYVMSCNGIDMDIQDINGDTFLHRVVRVPGTYRVIIAAMRAGANPLIQNNDGKTPEEILLNDQPPGWKENLHWLRKFLPGLYMAINEKLPDRSLVERLLKSWCRVNIIKNRKPCCLKTIVEQRSGTKDLLQLMEKHENTTEFVMKTLSGRASIVRKWMEESMMESVDINTNDHSFQYHYADYPEVPQPLLARAWEINDYGIIDVLMSLGVQTNALFTYGGKDEKLKPLFFQLISGKSKPTKEIVQRILIDCDPSIKNLDGQTLVYEAIEQGYPESFIKSLFKYGVDVGARDRYGRTARDYAGVLHKTNYFRVIDDYIIELVRDCNMEKIEALILQGYYPLLEIYDDEGYSLMEISKQQCSQELADMINKIVPIQEHIKSVFEAVNSRKLSEVKKIIGKRLAAGQDLCGRTVLHTAIMNKTMDIISYLANSFPHLLNIRDNLGRSPLHYAQLFLEGDVLRKLMTTPTANIKIKDVVGRTPSDYKCEICGKKTFCELQKDVLDSEVDVFLTKTDFENKLHSAIQKGRKDAVKKLVLGFKTRGDIRKFSSCLFDCIDRRRQDIAVYLIHEGMNTDIFKQGCDQSSPSCSTLDCNHTVVSFRDHVQQSNCIDVLKLVDEIEFKKGESCKNDKLLDVEEFAKYGLL